MVQKFIQRRKRPKNAGNRCLLAPIGVVCLSVLALAVPASAATEEAVEESSNIILELWSALISWLSWAVSQCATAYYNENGLTILGILACVLFASAAVCALFFWIRSLFSPDR